MEILEKTKKGTTKPRSRTDEIHQMSKEYISLLKNDNDNIYVKEFVDSNGILIHLKHCVIPTLVGYSQISVQFYFVESLLTTTINNDSPINVVFKLFLNNTFYYSYAPTQNCQLMSFGNIAAFINSFANLTANYAGNGYFNDIAEKTKLKYKPITTDISLFTKRIIKTIFVMLQKYSHFKNMVLIDVVSDQLPYVDKIFSDYYVNPGMNYTNTRGTPMTIKIFKTSSFYENIQPLT